MKKPCSICGVEKELKLFKIDGRYNSGYASICKVCNNLKQKQYSEVRYRANRKYAKTVKGKAALKRAQIAYEIRQAEKEN